MHSHDFSFRFMASVPFLALIIILIFGLNLGNARACEIYSYAVDSAGQVYVGVNSKITVYQDGEPVRSFSPGTTRGYKFTMLENDTLLVSLGSDMHTMDLEGNILERFDRDDGTYSHIALSFGKFVSPTGDTYQLTFFGWPRIVKNGTEVVYRVPGVSVLAAIIGGIAAAAAAVICVWEVVDVLKEHFFDD